MLESLLKWLSGLSNQQWLSGLAVVAAVMAAIPQWRYIRGFLWFLVGRRVPEIRGFGYSLSGPPHTARGRKAYLQGAAQLNVFIIGARMYLHWKVRGAVRVDLEPVARDVRGDGAMLRIDPSRRRFVLRARGLFGNVAEAVLELPADRFRRVDTRPISADVHLVREMPRIGTQRFSALPQGNHRLTAALPSTRLSRSGPMFRDIEGSRVDLESFIHPGERRKGLFRRLEMARMLRIRGFSTRRFDEVSKAGAKGSNIE